MATYNNSIWRDTFYEASASPFVYMVKDGDDVIFSGRAYRYPDAEVAKININKICENYLHQSFDGFLIDGFNQWTVPAALKAFTLCDDSGNTINTYRFLGCWDYGYNWTGQTGITISQPICDQYANGMVRFSSTIGITGGTQDPTVFNYAYTVSAGTLNCVDYALYYVNARGGLDSFAIQGTGIKTDTITAYSTDRAFNNTLPEFETMRNISEIKTSYELNTHYLTDEQAETLAKNLIGSNLVYLHCLKDGTIKPVVIDDKTATYQTYQTNGKKLCQYKIKVTESQTKRRRR